MSPYLTLRDYITGEYRIRCLDVYDGGEPVLDLLHDHVVVRFDQVGLHLGVLGGGDNRG